MYRCKYFKIYELVDEQVYNRLGENAFLLFDDRLLITLDTIREYAGVTIVNTWKNGGNLSLRGFRPFGCKIGAAYSQHKFGRAIDCHFKNASVDEVRKFIIENQEEKFEHIKGIELGTSWLHFDVRNSQTLQLFRP